MESFSIPINVRLVTFHCIKFKKPLMIGIRYVSSDSWQHGCRPMSESVDIVKIGENPIGSACMCN